MSLKTISPADAKRLIDDGAVLVDIRGADEHARERIPGARNLPVHTMVAVDSGSRPVLFHCKSGNRTNQFAGKLRDATTCEAYIVEGGIESWKRAGLPVMKDASQPLELQRQVQLIAGFLIVLGAVLSVSVSPVFVWLSAFVGAGLMLAGATGWCGMATMLAALPWNRRAAPGLETAR